MSHIIANFNKALRRKAQEEAQAQARGEHPAQPTEQAAANANANANVNAGANANAGALRVVPQERSLAVSRSAEHLGDGNERQSKRLKSPSNSINATDEAALANRATGGGNATDFARPPTKSKGKLWHEGDPALPRSAAPATAAYASQTRNARGSGRRHNAPKPAPVAPAADDPEDPSVSLMIAQPETRSISQEQLVAEVKGIYAGLVMVESKCIEVDSAHSVQNNSASRLTNDQLQALVALHRTLLHEHHDFFLASQHPSASPALQKLAQKYAMPARMWRHAIHSFLELLRHRLPASLEHMLTFIYLAYSMMALLYETVPAFKDTWVECLGDLARYRMAIEDEDVRDREIWTGVSRDWYTKASNKATTTGRLYHHLAILARPNALQQLVYYTKSLCVAIPFKSARDSILTLFEPVLNGTQNRQIQMIDFHFIKAHANLFILSNTNTEEKPLPKTMAEMQIDFQNAAEVFHSTISQHIAHAGRGWMEPGSYIAIANNNASLEYGKTEASIHSELNVIMASISPKAENDVQMTNTAGETGKSTPSTVFKLASKFVIDCDTAVLQRRGDVNILPYLHVRLVFLCFLADKPAMASLERTLGWAQLCDALNSFTSAMENFERVEADSFPKPCARPLPEDWFLRGHLWVEGLFPPDWHSEDAVEEDEKTFELPSMTAHRRERVLWLGHKLASFKRWIVYDANQKRFEQSPDFAEVPEEVQDADLTDSDVSTAVMTPTDSTSSESDSDNQSCLTEVGSMTVETDHI